MPQCPPEPAVCLLSSPSKLLGARHGFLAKCCCFPLRRLKILTQTSDLYPVQRIVLTTFTPTAFVEIWYLQKRLSACIGIFSADGIPFRPHFPSQGVSLSGFQNGLEQSRHLSRWNETPTAACMRRRLCVTPYHPQRWTALPTRAQQRKLTP